MVAAAALRGYLYAEVDRGLVQVAAAMADPFHGPDGAPEVPGLGPWARTCSTCRSPTPPGWLPPRIPPRLPCTDPPALSTLTPQVAAASGGAAHVVDSVSGSARWRVVSLPIADGSGSVTVAQDLSGVDATVSRLALIELAIGALVLLLLAVAARVLVRRSLRPLDHVEQAAALIAAGDLAHRAPPGDPRTEVGSLSASFNSMVDSLESSLAAQRLGGRRTPVGAGRP